MTNLFTDDPFGEQEGPGDELKINEKFAKKFDYENKLKDIHRLEDKYGKDAGTGAGEDDESSYYSESEDSDAYLNTKKAHSKFNELIVKIKSGDAKSLI